MNRSENEENGRNHKSACANKKEMQYSRLAHNLTQVDIGWWVALGVTGSSTLNPDQLYVAIASRVIKVLL